MIYGGLRSHKCGPVYLCWYLKLQMQLKIVQVYYVSATPADYGRTDRITLTHGKDRLHIMSLSLIGGQRHNEPLLVRQLNKLSFEYTFVHARSFAAIWLYLDIVRTVAVAVVLMKPSIGWPVRYVVSRPTVADKLIVVLQSQ